MGTTQILKALDKFIKIGDFVMVKLGASFLLLIVISITAGVVTRYVFNSPWSWTEELAQMLFIWISFLGAAVASARKKHIIVDVFVLKWNEDTRRTVSIITNILVLVFLAVVCIGGWELGARMIKQGHVSADLDMPKSWYYIPVLIASFYIAVVHVGDLIRDIFKLPRRESTV